MASEAPKYQNVLIREEDMTIHAINDEHGQYVHLEPIDTEPK